MERVVEEDDNLLEEILLRLPAEVVHGFKPVSKRWCNLISSTSFRGRHVTCHLHLPASSSKILMLDLGKASVTTLLDVHNGVTVTKTSNIESDKLLSSIRPFYEKLHQETDESKEIEFGILDVCDGLLLFSYSIRNRGDMFSMGQVYYFVCNPLTKEYQELPAISSKYKSSPCTFTEVAFAPSSKPYGCYKFIVVSPKRARHWDYAEYIVQVYSLQTGIWTDLGHIRHHSLYYSKSIVWDNCLLLVPRGQWHGSMCVLDSEKLRVSHSSSLLPFDENSEYDFIDYVGESGGFLYVVEGIKYYSDKEKEHYRLWEMNVNGSWKEKFQFQTEKETRTLYVHKEGEQVWLLLMLNYSTLYYCLNGNTESLEDAGDTHRYWRWNIRSYTPTLYQLGVCLNTNPEQEVCACLPCEDLSNAKSFDTRARLEAFDDDNYDVWEDDFDLIDEILKQKSENAEIEEMLGPSFENVVPDSQSSMDEVNNEEQRLQARELLKEINDQVPRVRRSNRTNKGKTAKRLDESSQSNTRYV